MSFAIKLSLLIVITNERGIDLIVCQSGWKFIYPSHFKMQDPVGVRSALGKALIAENGYSLVKINNVA